MLSAERPHRDYELPVRRRRVSMLKRMSISAAPAASVSAAAVNAPASVAAAPRSAFNNIMDEDAAASAYDAYAIANGINVPRNFPK